MLQSGGAPLFSEVFPRVAVYLGGGKKGLPSEQSHTTKTLASREFTLRSAVIQKFNHPKSNAYIVAGVVRPRDVDKQGLHALSRIHAAFVLDQTV